MIDELTASIEGYETEWKKLVDDRADKPFFDTMYPTAVAWKTVDQADFDTRFAELRDISDNVHLGWVNNRWLATFHLKESTLPMGITLVKLMQRRPGSNDATGLDHLDFIFKPGPTSLKEVLEQEHSLKWDEETNGDFCKWISIWFAGGEAKIRSDTVLDVCATEMKELEKKIVK
jgi:hypothetical protein